MSHTSQLLPAKKDVLEALLARGTSVYLHLDPRRPGVSAPPGFAAQAELVLRVGHALVPAIPDLVVDADGVRCTLRFRGAPHLCVLPWSSIYALVGDEGRGVVWPDDVPVESSLAGPRPSELATPPAASPAAPDAASATAKAPRRKPRKTAGEPRRAAAAAGEAPRGSTPGSKPKRALPPYLRVVK